MFWLVVNHFRMHLVNIGEFTNNKYLMFNPLPDDKTLDWPKLKQIAGGDILNCI